MNSKDKYETSFTFYDECHVNHMKISTSPPHGCIYINKRIKNLYYMRLNSIRVIIRIAHMICILVLYIYKCVSNRKNEQK